MIETTAEAFDSEKIAKADVTRFRTTAVSGYGASPDGIFRATLLDDIQAHCGLDTMAESIGEWLAVGHIPDETAPGYLVLTDAYGYSPCFYTLVPGVGLILSSSFYGVIKGLRDHGVVPTLDLDNYLATLSSKHQLFDNPTTYRTMCQEVRLLQVNEAIYVTSDQAAFVDRTSLRSHQTDDYDSQLSRGIELSIQILDVLASDPSLDHVLYLSGGVDSRLILALLKAGGLEKSYKIRSRDPRVAPPGYSQNVFTADIRIVANIREDLGLEWMPEPSKHKLPWSFRESLAAFQSYRSNFSFAFNPTISKDVYTVPRVTLSGGGGEILRATESGALLSKKISELSSITGSTAADRIEEWLVSEIARESPFTLRIRDVYRGWLAPRAHHSEETILNLHYLHNRNRTHFGHGRYSASGNEVLLHPLSHPSFLAAAGATPLTERAEGKIVLDIFTRTSPQLLNYVFENPRWTDKLATTQAVMPLTDDSWAEDYDKAVSTSDSNQTRSQWVSGRLREPEPYDPRAASVVYLKAAFELIETLVRADDYVPLRKLHQTLLHEIDSNVYSPFSFVAKAASAVDVFLPLLTSGKKRVFSFSAFQRARETSWANLSYTVPILPQDGWNDAPLPLLNPSIQRNGARILADSGADSNVSGFYEFAFYLSKDGKRMERHWYTPNSRVEFQNYGSGEYKLESFIRRVGSKNPVNIQNVSEDLRFD